MVKKTKAGVKAVPAKSAKSGNKNRREFCFAIKVVPVNADPGYVIMLPTKVRVPDEIMKVAYDGQVMTLEVGKKPEHETRRAFRFEVWDLNTPEGLRNCLRSSDGEDWRADATDYAVFTVVAE